MPVHRLQRLHQLLFQDGRIGHEAQSVWNRAERRHGREVQGTLRADIQRLLDVLHRLTDAGNTVIVIEHNLDVIRTADWIIDLGPEGGEKGGYIVAEGTPEEVALVGGSHTGRFLKEMLGEKISLQADK